MSVVVFWRLAPQRGKMLGVARGEVNSPEGKKTGGFFLAIAPQLG